MKITPRIEQPPADKIPGNETLVERATTVVVFLVGSEGKEYIMLLHKETKSRDDWEIPGGTVESKEAVKDTVIREVFEEAGLTVRNYELSAVNLLAEHVGNFLKTAEKTIQTKVLLAYLLAQSIEAITQSVSLGDEHSEYLLVQNPNTRDQDYRDTHLNFVNQLRNRELRVVNIQGNVWEIQSDRGDTSENGDERTIRLSEVTADALIDYANWDLSRL